jgi:hypothetical protein
LTTMRAIERALGDKSKSAEFIAEYGPVHGPLQYQQWRTAARTKLTHTTTLYTQIKRELEQEARQDPTVQLFEQIWQQLAPLPEMAAIREQIRLHVRNTYQVFFIDRQKETDHHD